MAAVHVISGDQQFGKDGINIVVLPSEHHGKVSLHKHPFFEFVYVESGFALHTCNNVASILTSGDLFAVKPSDVHSYNSAYHAKIYNCLFDLKEVLELDEIKKLPGINNLFLEEDVWTKIHLDLVQGREMVILLEKMRWEQTYKLSGWKQNMRSYLITFLVMYSRIYQKCHHSAQKKDNIYFKRIAEVLQYIENNYDKDIDVKDIAEAVDFSPDYITRQFKSVIGFSPVEYLRHFRIAKVMEQLRTTDKPIAQISSECGFSDVSHFSRQFRQIVGKTPMAFRKSEE